MIDYHDDEFDALVQDRDRLRLEFQHLREHCRQIEAKNDDLRRDNQAFRDRHFADLNLWRVRKISLLAEVTRLCNLLSEVEAERDKFRDALLAIKSFRPDPEDKADPYLQIAVHTMRIARTALGLYTFKPS